VGDITSGISVPIIAAGNAAVIHYTVTVDNPLAAGATIVIRPPPMHDPQLRRPDRALRTNHNRYY